MQKKYKRAIIITSVSLVVITLVLILLGLGRVQIGQLALNYNLIAANFTNNAVYEPGLYMIGIASKFIRINKNQKAVKFQNLTTYSSDYYLVSATIEVAYMFNFTTGNNFEAIANFYIMFGDYPDTILNPLMKHQILDVLSNHDSQFYQSGQSIIPVIENSIAYQIQTVIQKWVGVSVTVQLQSILCEGVSSNTQIIDRQIEALMHDMERTVSSQVDLTNYFKQVHSKKQLAIESVANLTQIKAKNLERVFQLYGQGLNGLKIAQILYENKPLKYNMNLVNVLEELAIIGNRTFPY